MKNAWFPWQPYGKKVQVDNDQETAQSERISLSRNRVGKN